LISLAVTIAVGLAWLSGYFSSLNGWWWTVFGIIIIYVIIYKLIEV
jgi:hypothetical protein